MSTLPKGWTTAPLDKICQIVRGVSYTKNVASTTAGNNLLPILRANNIQNGSVILDDFIYIPAELIKSEQLIKKHDILVAMSSGSKNLVGKAGIAKSDFNGGFGTFCGVLRPLGGLDARYVGWFTRTKYYSDLVSSLSKGVNINNLKPSHFSEITTPIAPLNEQIRIADKLDSILAKVNKAQERLDKIPGILKRFRQSILAAATSGELTREMRGNDTIVTTDIAGLSIPVEWQFCTVEDIGVVKGGKRLPKGDELTENNTGFPYIRAGQLKNGTVVQGESARNKQMFLEPETQAQIKRYTVNEGDVYLTIVGASIGDAGVIPHALHQANLTENAAKITNFNERINAQYLSIWLRSERLQELIQLEIKSGAQGKLALKRINTLPVPLPPIDEQHEIVNIVAALLSHAETLDRCYQEVKSRVDRLSQSILAKAFRGELVEQNPADEPADKLLERIKQQQLESPKAARQTRKPAAKVAPSVDVVETDIELARPESEILALLKKTSGELSAQQIMDKLTEKTFEQVDALFTELKRLLDANAVVKVGSGEACTFKAIKR